MTWRSFLLVSLFFAVPTQAQENGGALPLPEILNHSSPFDLYSNAYGSFRFISRARLDGVRDEGVPPIEATTDLSVDEHGNFHLLRKPLNGTASLELIYLDRRFHMRKNVQETFRALRPQAEFYRWVNSSFREVFEPLQTAGVNAAPECPRKAGAMTCLDPVHGLPLEGEVPKPVKGLGSLTVSFRIDPAPPGTVQIAMPKPSPEKPGK